LCRGITGRQYKQKTHFYVTFTGSPLTALNGLWQIELTKIFYGKYSCKDADSPISKSLIVKSDRAFSAKNDNKMKQKRFLSKKVNKDKYSLSQFREKCMAIGRKEGCTYLTVSAEFTDHFNNSLSYTKLLKVRAHFSGFIGIVDGVSVEDCLKKVNERIGMSRNVSSENPALDFTF